MIKLNLIICIVFIEGIVPSILRTENMQLFVRKTKKITLNPNCELFRKFGIILTVLLQQ